MQHLSEKHALGPGDVTSVLENYPPSDRNAMLAKMLTALQAVVVLGALTVEKFVVLPAEIREKKMLIVMGALFVGNTMKNSLLSTGAFEVMFDEQVVWSKLATGQMPRSEVDLVGAVEAVLAKLE
jgi:selT/selW/selH-like putative selenoprotein